MKVLCSVLSGSAGTVLGQTMRAVGVAHALRRRGHEIVFVCGAPLRSTVEGHGFRVLAVDVPSSSAAMWSKLASEDPRERREVANAAAAMSARMTEAARPALDAERPDVVLSGDASAPIAAADRGIPSALVVLQPHGPRTVHFLVDRLLEVEEARARALAVAEAVDRVLVEGTPELGPGVSVPLLAPYAGKVRYVGPLTPDPPDELPAPETLKARWGGEVGRPFVYVTVGGGSPLMGLEFLELALGALGSMPGARGLVSTGLDVAADRLAGAPPNALVRRFVPGLELVRASDVVVFHGGSSTLMQCIACGRPAVAIPSIDEQADNADVLVRSGAGIALDKATLTARGLADAIEHVLATDGFRASARSLQQMADRCGGARAAALLVEEIVRGRTR